MHEQETQRPQDTEIVLNLKLSQVNNILATLCEVPMKFAEVPVGLLREMVMNQLEPIAPPPEAPSRPRIIKG